MRHILTLFRAFGLTTLLAIALACLFAIHPPQPMPPLPGPIPFDPPSISDTAERFWQTIETHPAQNAVKPPSAPNAR